MRPFDILREAIEAPVLDHFEVPPRSERLAPAPPAYRTGPIAAWLDRMTSHQGMVWLHQAKTIDELEEGHDVVVATPTASGKTLVMQAPIIRELLSGSGRTFMLFCPQRGLSSNQLMRWRNALALAGLSQDLVGEINGHVPTCERDTIIQRASILIVTEDIVHTSLLRQLSTPSFNRFICNLGMIAIDEAHSLEGVFGSNCAFLFRRLEAAHRKARRAAGLPARRFQVVAASATIADPGGHLERLTGRAFKVVSEVDNGAPFHGLQLLHIEGPDHGAAAETMLAEYVSRIAERIGPDAGIAFVDNRQGVERITALVGMSEVEPYRSGHKKFDRAAIEKDLHDGKLRFVVSTSALELGVDVPQFTVGLNLGVPQTIKSFRQRVGRAGRSSEAVFAIIAPASALSKLGMTLREFYEATAEESPLYLSNPIIQFQHASCLLEECGGPEASPGLPPDIEWPEGFEQAWEWVTSGSARPREIEQVAALSSGNPHRDYPLRRIGAVEFALRDLGTGDLVGTIDLDKAMREAYPGATFYQRKQPFRAVDWRQTGYERSIYLQSIPHGPRTTPILLTHISVSHEASELQEGRLLASDRGSLAEIRLHVTESVHGYAIGPKQFLYRDLAQTDRRKSKKQRNYSTTGVLLRLEEPWFNGHGGSAADMRKQVASALATVFARERSIAAGELGFAYGGIAMHAPGGPRPIHDAIVIYDDMPGGLRLTQPLFGELPQFLERLRRGAELAGAEALLDEMTVTRLERWYRQLRPKDKALEIIPSALPGERLVYAAGSVVGVRIHGALVERSIIGHQLLSFEGKEHLVYTYETEPGVTGIVPHSQVEPVGHDWQMVLWDSGTGLIREIAA